MWVSWGCLRRITIGRLITVSRSDFVHLRVEIVDILRKSEDIRQDIRWRVGWGIWIGLSLSCGQSDFRTRGDFLLTCLRISGCSPVGWTSEGNLGRTCLCSFWQLFRTWVAGLSSSCFWISRGWLWTSPCLILRELLELSDRWGTLAWCRTQNREFCCCCCLK